MVHAQLTPHRIKVFSISALIGWFIGSIYLFSILDWNKNPVSILIVAILIWIIIYILLWISHRIIYKMVTRNIPLNQNIMDPEIEELQYKMEQAERLKRIIITGVISLILWFFPAVFIGFAPIAHSAPAIWAIPYLILIFGLLIFCSLFLAYLVYRSISLVILIIASLLFPHWNPLEMKNREWIAIWITILIFGSIAIFYILKQYWENLLYPCPNCNYQSPFS